MSVYSFICTDLLKLYTNIFYKNISNTYFIIIYFVHAK